jgi:hypothetical protein
MRLAAPRFQSNTVAYWIDGSKYHYAAKVGENASLLIGRRL